MSDIFDTMKATIFFINGFWFENCMKTMIAGIVFMSVMGFARRTILKKQPDIRYALWLFLPMMLLVGRNKVFFAGKLFHISNFLNFWIQEIPALAVVYTAVAGVLFLRFAWINGKLNRYVKGLPEYHNGDLRQYVLGKICSFDPYGRRKPGKGIRAIRYRFLYSYLKRCKWVVTPEQMSSFSAGVIKPYVVIPEHYLRNLEQEELVMVLIHEMLHIAEGHLVMLHIFSLLKVCWWGNPFILFCDKVMRQDMEMVCDNRTIACSSGKSVGYGMLLLKVAGNKRKPFVQTAAFGSDLYKETKRRILNITRYVKQEDTAGGKRIFRYKRNCSGKRMACILLIMLFLAIVQTSYPRYIELTDITLCDSKGITIDNNTERLSFIFTVEGEGISYDDEAFAAYLEENPTEETQFYICYGGFMKMPGVGGGLNIAYLDWDGSRVLENCVSDDLFTRIQMWFLKWA